MKKETLYHLNNFAYKTVSWTSKQSLLYKLSQRGFDTKLSSSEEIEHEKLFFNYLEIPKELDVKRCILVIVSRDIVAIGVEIVNQHNIIAFKSARVKETITMCRKYNIIIRYEKRLADYLFCEAYLNEIIPENTWREIAVMYARIMKKDKIFAKKMNILFGI
jgi:type III secretion system FlhB-like substrate exporter